MAEAIMRQLASDSGLDIAVSSAAVSSEEEGNDIYPPAKRILKAHGVPFSRHHAHRITEREFAESDLVVAMDESNVRALQRRFGNPGKLRMLLPRPVADPWYTDDFETAYRDILSGCRSLLEVVESAEC